LVTTIAQSVIVGPLRHQPVSTADRQSINNFHIYIFKLQSWSCWLDTDDGLSRTVYCCLVKIN